MSKHSSPLDLLDDGFESQLICSLYLKICHEDEELKKMETAVNYSNFLITGNFLRADYKPPTMTEAKVAAKLHGCLDIIQTSDTISSEEQSLLGYDKDGEAVCETTKQQKASLICAESYVNDESNCSRINSDHSEGDEETIASFWRKDRKDKLTTPDIDQSLPLHRPQIITPEMQSSPKLPPKFSLQDILSPQTGNLKLILPKPTFPKSILSTPHNNSSSSIIPKKRKMIDELNETIEKMNEIYQTQTISPSTKLSFEEAMEELVNFKSKFGHFHIPKVQPYLNLYEFCIEYREWYQRHVSGQGLPMSEYSINALNAIGFDWETLPHGHKNKVSDTTNTQERNIGGCRYEMKFL